MKRPKLRKTKTSSNDGNMQQSNALGFINLCDLNVSDLAEWSKKLPAYKELLYGASNEADTQICNQLSSWIFEQELSGKHIGSNESFKRKEFEDMMNGLNVNDDYEYEWIWNVIKECQMCTERSKDEKLTSLDWIPSSWQRFVLINGVKTESCSTNEDKCQPIVIEECDDEDSLSDLERETTETVKTRECHRSNGDEEFDCDEFLWKRTAEILFEKLQKIESHTQTAQRNVKKLQTKLDKKRIAVKFLENEIESRWNAYKAKQNRTS